MKLFALILFVTFMAGQPSIAQRLITSGNDRLEILDQIYFSNGIVYNEVIKDADQPFVILFKRYFNPPSFEAYKSFFLSNDWAGFTIEQFNEWQDRLKRNALWLENILYVRNQNAHEFVILQYTMESKEYVIPSAAIFKKVNQEWKHISNVNDQQTPFLKSIGTLDPSYITSMPRDHFLLERNQVAQRNERSATEKFDRYKLFAEAKSIFMRKGVSPSDMEYAEELFLKKAEHEMVNYIGEAYAIDPFILMEELNQVFGFSLFKFISTLKAK